MTFDLNNPWLIGIFCTAFGVIIILYFEYRKEKTLKATRMTSINSADSLLENNMNQDALEIYKSMLEFFSEGKDSKIYAYIKNNEGSCYVNLAGISNKEENLRKAIQAYEDALKIYTEKYPVNYATIQNNLGAAYKTLAEVREKEENLRKAIQAYEETLKP